MVLMVLLSGYLSQSRTTCIYLKTVAHLAVAARDGLRKVGAYVQDLRSKNCIRRGHEADVRVDALEQHTITRTIA